MKGEIISNATVGNKSMNVDKTFEEAHDSQQPSPALSIDALSSMLAAAEGDEEEAKARKRKATRDVDSMTEDLANEVRELLEVLGLPYMIAPFEAEAQCAVLEQVNRTVSNKYNEL